MARRTTNDADVYVSRTCNGLSVGTRVQEIISGITGLVVQVSSLRGVVVQWDGRRDGSRDSYCAGLLAEIAQGAPTVTGEDRARYLGTGQWPNVAWFNEMPADEWEKLYLCDFRPADRDRQYEAMLQDRLRGEGGHITPERFNAEMAEISRRRDAAAPESTGVHPNWRLLFTSAKGEY